MAYKKSHFDKCSFNPMIEGNMLQAYPMLAEIVVREWTAKAEFNSLLKYVVFMYDPKSPLFANEKDLNHRKGVAAELAGFDMDDTALLMGIYSCTHPYIVELTVRYLIRFAKSMEYTAIVVVENCFWESTRKLMEPISGDNSKQELEAVQKKSAIKDELDKDIARLEKYKKAFFGEDEVMVSEAKSRPATTPEAMAMLSKVK